MKLARRLGLQIDFKEVEQGRALISARLEKGSAEPSAGEKRPWLIHRLMSAPVFHHLWFLWHLLLIALGFAAWCAAEGRFGTARPWPGWLAWTSAWAAASLLGLGMDPAGFGPDTSIGLIPFPAVILTYAVCFSLGCWMRRSGIKAAPLGWISGARWTLGALIGIGAAGAWAAFPEVQADPRLSAPIEAACAFLLSWSALGWARAWRSGESRIVRWVSDSSYWLYLAHLPLVVFLQGALVSLAWPGWIKGAVIAGLTSGLLWLSYGLWVRHSWLGKLLHGPRERRSGGPLPS
jgi:peptidoglycan/LPS O-acetylase OafA/YrhL